MWLKQRAEGGVGGAEVREVSGDSGGGLTFMPKWRATGRF